MATARRTLVKSPPELWDIVTDGDKARTWIRDITGVDGYAERADALPPHSLVWRGGNPGDPVKLAFRFEEKGFGTRVSISCDRDGDAQLLDRLLDELAEPERRPFARD